MRAVNTYGEGEGSATETLTTSGVPSNVSTLSASLVSSSSNTNYGRVKLTWTAPGNGGSVITNYKIWRREAELWFFSCQMRLPP